MKIQRIFIILLLVLFSTLLQAGNEGIALVHGTSDHREDAYGDYWKTDFIEELSHALDKPDNIYVVHCDFRHYMWEAEVGDCTARQLARFIKQKNISSLTVYTHSNGGNVLRWILSNPTYSEKYFFLKDKISQVIALAPSSGGTPLADLVLSGTVLGSSIAWILDYSGGAIKQQREGDMRIYNEELLFGTRGRPKLPVPFKAIIGTNVIASPISSASYCNGYILNSGLKISKLYLDGCSDGFLNCSSQNIAGEVWFYDTEKLVDNLTLSHNQSRHSCFGLGKILISALATKGASK